VGTANGVRIVPDLTAPPSEMLSFPDQPPADVLDFTLGEIGERYGVRTADVVAMQLEYPRGP
jgi:hypothetical protein